MKGTIMAKFDMFTYTIKKPATGEAPAPSSAQEDEIAMQSRAELEFAAMWNSSGPSRARLLQR